MKKLAILLFLLSGFVFSAQAQAPVNKVERFFNKKKTRQFIPMKSHFEKQKKDPRMKHNGTSVRTKNSVPDYKTDSNGFGIEKAKKSKAEKAPRVKKRTNKNFRTPVRKIKR